MIKQALYDFLTDDSTLSDSVRNTARQNLRELIGTRIHNNRRPRGTDEMALTISKSSGFVLKGLSKPVNCAQPILDFTIWSIDKPYTEGNDEKAFDALKSLLHQYRGPLNDTVSVQVISLESEPFEQPVAPADLSDGWTHRQTCSFLIGYNTTAPAGVS